MTLWLILGVNKHRMGDLRINVNPNDQKLLLGTGNNSANTFISPNVLASPINVSNPSFLRPTQ